MNWKKLESIADLEAALEASNDQAIALFKHSTRCPVSSMAKRLVERDWNLNIDAYFLDLIAYREVSNAIAERLKVQHQSPQMIVVKNGASIYDASHESIQVAAMAEAL